MAENKDKTPPKGNVRFSISLSEEQKRAKAQILNHPFNFVIGKAGSGKTLLACQIGLDMFFKRQVNKIVINIFPSFKDLISDFSFIHQKGRFYNFIFKINL